MSPHQQVSPPESASKPTFSVIVPFHLSASFSRNACLDELLASLPDRPDLEVVMVNDRSEEPYVPATSFCAATLRIVDAPAGSRFAGMARNHGLDLARGTWIIFADSDDRFTPEFGAVLDQVSGFSDDSIDLCLFRVSSFRDDGVLGDRHVLPNAVCDRFAQEGNPLVLVEYRPPWGKVISRTFIDRYALRFGSSRVANDVLFSTELSARRPRTVVSHRVAYDIREGNPSLTSDGASATTEIHLAVARQAQDLLIRLGVPEAVIPLRYSLMAFWGRSKWQVTKVALGCLLRGEIGLPNRIRRKLGMADARHPVRF